MNECYIKLLKAVQAECDKHEDCFSCKYRDFCEALEVALEAMEAEND